MVINTIESIFNIECKNKFDLYLINNTSEDQIIEKIKLSFKQVIIKNNNKPKGFSENVNTIINNYVYKYYLLINPDIVCLKGVIDILVEYMESTTDVAIAGPQLLNPDGSIQFSCRRFSKITSIFIRGLHLDKVFKQNKIISQYLMNDFDHNKILNVDWITGAFMILRSRAINKIGNLDSENFFLYSEDQDLCLRAWKQSWKVVYIPKAKAIHHHLRYGVNRPFSKNALQQIVSTYNLFKKHNWRLTR